MSPVLSLSVIVPVLDEGEGPVTLLGILDRSPLVGEVLVVESRDDPSPRLSLAHGWSKVRFLQAERGRGRQLDAGATAATGEVLLFLHADSRLEAVALARLLRALRRPGPIAAAFRLRFRERHRGLSLLAGCGRFLSELSPYALGDQGLAVRRGDYLAVGGYPDVPILEDWLLVRRLRERGRIVILDAPYATSGRRFLRAGIARQLWTNARILYRYGEGHDLAALAREYAESGNRHQQKMLRRSAEPGPSKPKA